MTSQFIRNFALLCCLTLAVTTGYLVAGCSQNRPADDAVVAEVAGRKIKMRDITDYITSLSVHYPTAADEYNARQRYLTRLIEDKFLIIGGYERTLDADISILEAVDAEKEKFLLDELYRVEVIDKVTVEESEIREIYNHWFDRVKFRHIVVKEREKADSILALAKSGADFADLAERHSIDASTRFRGGDPGREFSYNELPVDMAKLAFSLGKGEVGGPAKSEMGFHIMMVEETRKLESRDFESVKPSIEANLRRRKQQERRAAHLEQVEKESNITFDPQTLTLWREKFKQVADTSSMPKDRLPAVPASSLTPQEAERVIYTFGSDYKVGLGEFCDALESRSPFERPDPYSETQLRRFAFQMSLFDILHEEALRQRLDESPIYKERVQNFLESMMADRMRNSVLVRGITVTESEVRAFFDANPDSFILPAAYHCREILVHRPEEAERLANQLRAGASFEELARLHTQRAGMRSTGGDIGWVSPDAWPVLYEPASKLKPGEWTGPITAVDQYSLIQLIESRPPTPRAYEDVATEIFESIQRRRRDSIFTAYIDSMRVLYPVTINEDLLKSGLTGPQGQIDSVKSS